MTDNSTDPGKGLRDRKDKEYPEWVRAAAFAITGEEAGSEKRFPTPFGNETRLGIIRVINACFVGKIVEGQMKNKYNSEHINHLYNRPDIVAGHNITLLGLPPAEGNSHWWELKEGEKDA